jgi:ABC-type enterochelin transport system substrate-binding protein
MSFFKKLGETVMDTASTIGSKTMDMVGTGKLKLQKSELEDNIQDKKTLIGNLVYVAYKENGESNSEELTKLFDEIKELEKQVAEVEEKLNKETAQPAPKAEETAAVVKFCSNCGKEIPAEAKFCNHCGQPQ